MLKVGLTGSIAVGKSFVCNVFRELGCYVVDADQTSREVVEPNTPGLASIVAEFGTEVLNLDGTLDRKKLGAIVFGDESKRQLLNSIVHPLVKESQNNWLAEVEAKDPNAIAIVDAALMIESGGYKRFDKLIVVWCKPEIQLQRLIERDGLSIADAKARINAQMTQDEKRSYADLEIDTSGTYEETRQKTIEVFELLKRIES